MAHDNDHAHHSTLHTGQDSLRQLFWAILFTGGFMVAEVVGGILSGSLALLADAGHMLTDTAARQTRNARSATTGCRSSPPSSTA